MIPHFPLRLDNNAVQLLLAGAFATYQVQDFLATKDEFMPERWLIPGKSSIASSKTKGVSAFGSGPRVCAGEALAWAEMKVSSLLQNVLLNV